MVNSLRFVLSRTGVKRGLLSLVSTGAPQHHSLVAVPSIQFSSCTFNRDQQRKQLQSNNVSSRGFKTTTPSMEKFDPYVTLGVNKDASASDIKKAYYKLAKKFHPDSGSGDEKKFQNIQKAYEILSDEKKKQMYDQFGFADGEGGGRSSPDQEGFGGFGGFGGFNGFQGNPFEGFGQDDPFASFFRNASSERAQKTGASIQMELKVTFEEAVFGAKKEVSYVARSTCDTCHGSGAKPGTEPTKCNYCKGTGMMYVREGLFQIQTTCPHCHGEGKVIKDPCKPCSGSGVHRKTRSIIVDIPEGVDSGTNLRIPNQGHAGEHKAPSGHLLLRINVMPSDVFKRKGSDIHLQVPISISQAIMGEELEVPTLKGTTKVKVQPGTQSGEEIKLKGKGVKELSSRHFGDQIISFKVSIPNYDSLTEKQKELIKEFSSVDSSEDKKKEKKSSIFERLKKKLEKDSDQEEEKKTG